jgi:hypothetical protein
MVDNRPPFVAASFRPGQGPQAVMISFEAENLTPGETLDELFSRESLVAEFDATAKAWRVKARELTRADLTDWCERNAPEWRQLEEAFRRPHAQIKVGVGDRKPNDPDPLAIPLPGFASVRHTAYALALRCRLHLLEGDSAAAVRDVELLHRLQESSTAVPSLVCSAIHIALATFTAAIIEEGLAEGLWRPEQLPVLQRIIAADNLLATFRSGLDAERILAVGTARSLAGDRFNPTSSDFSWSDLSPLQFYEFTTSAPQYLPMKLLLPRGVFYQNMADAAQLEILSLDALNPASLRVSPGLIVAEARARERQLRRPARFETSIKGLVNNINYTKLANRTAINQTRLHLALVACGLERHHAAHGSYPDQLAALVPAFVEKLPHDLFDGQPLRYRRTADGYQLYSIGWNGKDDGGIASSDRSGKPEWNSDSGDWLWNGVPAK